MTEHHVFCCNGCGAKEFKESHDRVLPDNWMRIIVQRYEFHVCSTCAPDTQVTVNDKLIYGLPRKVEV